MLFEGMKESSSRTSWSACSSESAAKCATPRDGRAVDGPARARPHDATDLRDDSGGERVAQEDVGVAAEADDALLYARAARIVEPDDGRADAHREV
jgi:hypothetical protein